MEVAADRYGGTERIFNAAGFSQAFCQLSGVPGTTLDGKLVRAILSGRPDCALLWGSSHFRIIQPGVALKVSVVAYQGKIVICPQAPEQGVDQDGWWPTGGGKGGCVLVDSRRLLGVSEEALLLMQSVVRNHDAVGDLGWWECDDGKYAFSWWGPIFRIVDPKKDEASREFRVWRDECTIIPNQVPEAAKLVIDAGHCGDTLLATQCFWAEPIYIDRPGDEADGDEADGDGDGESDGGESDTQSL